MRRAIWVLVLVAAGAGAGCAGRIEEMQGNLYGAMVLTGMQERAPGAWLTTSSCMLADGRVVPGPRTRWRLEHASLADVIDGAPGATVGGLVTEITPAQRAEVLQGAAGGDALLFEVASNRIVVAIYDTWRDADGLHFFLWSASGATGVRPNLRGTGFLFNFPGTGPATRVVYTPGSFEIARAPNGAAYPVGTPAGVCVLDAQ